jgi:hypothetical protein
MASVRVRFSMTTFERDFTIDAASEEEASAWLSDDGAEEWSQYVIDRVDVDVVDGEYDQEAEEPEEPEEEEEA